MIKRTTERNPYFELLRGIAIIMVVGIHTFKAGSDFSLFVRQMLNCAVPLFLACSGFFMAKKDVSDKIKHKAFLSKQIPKVYLPCLVWSIPYLIISLCNGGSVIKGLLNLFLCGFSIYYFILLIMQYYALLPYYQKMNKKHLLINAAVSLVSIAIVAYLIQIQQRSIPLVSVSAMDRFLCLWSLSGKAKAKKPQIISLCNYDSLRIVAFISWIKILHLHRQWRSRHKTLIVPLFVWNNRNSIQLKTWKSTARQNLRRTNA